MQNAFCKIYQIITKFLVLNILNTFLITVLFSDLKTDKRSTARHSLIFFVRNIFLVSRMSKVPRWFLAFSTTSSTLSIERNIFCHVIFLTASNSTFRHNVLLFLIFLLKYKITSWYFPIISVTLNVIFSFNNFFFLQEKLLYS